MREPTEKESCVLIRPSKHLSLRLEEGRYIAQNHLVGQERVLPISVITLLASITDFISTDTMSEHLKKLFPQSLVTRDAVAELTKSGILVKKQSELHVQEERFNEWVWSREAAKHFLATRRVRWMKESVEVEAFGKLLRTQELPSLWDDVTAENESWEALGVHIGARETFNLLKERRSLRQFSNDPIASEALGAILSAGLGIQKFLKLPLRPTYPLRFSPSPGGLNVFTGYIFVKNVSNLSPGIYRYNALRNQVLKIGELPDLPLSYLFGNQTWADEASAVCLLIANYKRMAWKYSDQSAFNSLLIESGHIAQNMMVCAASLSVGSVPTNAVAQAELEQYLSLTFPHHAVLYALAFGHEDMTRSKDHYSSASLLRLKEIVGGAT